MIIIGSKSEYLAKDAAKSIAKDISKVIAYKLDFKDE